MLARSWRSSVVSSRDAKASNAMSTTTDWLIPVRSDRLRRRAFVSLRKERDVFSVLGTAVTLEMRLPGSVLVARQSASQE